MLSCEREKELLRNGKHNAFSLLKALPKLPRTRNLARLFVVFCYPAASAQCLHRPIELSDRNAKNIRTTF